MNIGALDLIYIIIMFQLSLFSLFLFVKRPGKLSNYLLGIQLISQAAGIFTGFCYLQMEYFYNINPHLFFIGFPFPFLWGPSFYLFVKSAAFIDFKLKYKYIIHIIPFLAALIFLTIFYFPLGLEEKKQILSNRLFPIIRYSTFIDYFIRAHVLFYIILSLCDLHLLRKKIQDHYSSISKTNYSWIRFIVVGFTAAYMLSIPFIIYWNIFHKAVQIVSFASIFIYFIYFNFIYFKAWYQSDIFSGIEETSKYKSSKLTKEEASILIAELEKFIETNKPYFNPDLSLNQLAESIQIQPRILSQIINENYNQNFQNYINRLRIEESKKYLCDSTNKKTILEILYEVGFNSKTAFNIAFKKATGLTPTEYKKRFRQDVVSDE